MVIDSSVRDRLGVIALAHQDVIGTETAASQTRPNRAAGKDHVRVMSCSDKLLSWMTLGLQGSLLSTLMPPVYARSFIFGSMFDLEVIEQTLTRRADDLSLPSPFVFNMPHLIGNMGPEPASDLPRRSNFSFNWSRGDLALEVVDAASGLQVNKQPSRICKQRLYEQYNRACARLSTMSSVQSVPPGLPYRQAKAASKTHQAAKEALLAHLEPRLGYWIRKPHDLDGFSLHKPPVVGKARSPTGGRKKSIAALRTVLFALLQVVLSENNLSSRKSFIL